MGCTHAQLVVFVCLEQLDVAEPLVRVPGRALRRVAPAVAPQVVKPVPRVRVRLPTNTGSRQRTGSGTPDRGPDCAGPPDFDFKIKVLA